MLKILRHSQICFNIGFIIILVWKPIDLMMSATEKIVVISREGGIPCLGAHRESWGSRANQEAKGGRKLWAKAFIVVFSERRQSKWIQDWLVWITSGSSGGTGTVLSCLVLVPGVIKARRNWPERENPDKEWSLRCGLLVACFAFEKWTQG